MSTQLNDTLTGHARQHHHLIDCCELRNYVCRKFLRKRSLYEYLLPSCDINVCIVSLICPETATVPHAAVQQKCVCVPTRHDNEFAVLPLAHIEQ